jgi:hypothetical protein
MRYKRPLQNRSFREKGAAALIAANDFLGLRFEEQRAAVSKAILASHPNTRLRACEPVGTPTEIIASGVRQG